MQFSVDKFVVRTLIVSAAIAASDEPFQTDQLDKQRNERIESLNDNVDEDVDVETGCQCLKE